MVPTEPSTYPVSEIESLIAALMGVIAARVVVSEVGRIEEIHVLADEQLHPKQIVRNIESALSAGLGMSVDRRLVSIAQVRADEDDDDDVDEHLPVSDGAADDTSSTVDQDAVPEADAGDDVGAAHQPDPALDAEPADDAAAASDADDMGDAGAVLDAGAAPDAGAMLDAGAAHDAAADFDAPARRAARPITRDAAIASRYVFVGYDARTQPDLEAACRVTIRRGSEVISGNGTGPSTMLGRAQAAARAVFAAISAARRDHSLGLEGTTLVERHGRSYVLVAAHATTGRDSMPLTGAAAMHRSPEEAAILASLQATNRWAELDG